MLEGFYKVRFLVDYAVGRSVMYAHAGSMFGGDAFYYLGTCSSANGRWKGQILNQEHTPAKGEHPIFGGYEVGIGLSVLKLIRRA